MPERIDRDELPQATVVPRHRARVSVVWIIPILAAVVAVGIAVQRILSEGPTITIVFKAAEGLEAGKTFVKYKDVNIGQVTAVRLSPDYGKVEVTAKIAKSAAGLMVEDARFWVVEPRVTLSGISGLGTLLSGNYIGFGAGKSTKAQRDFTGLEVAPVVTAGEPGRQFRLKADTLGSLGIGSPIYYRRLQAGQVIAFKLAGDGKSIDLTVFVNAPFDRYVDPGTRFWNASGVDVSIGAGGVDVRTQSLVALLAGGVAFDTPSFAIQGVAAAPDTVYTLYNDEITAMKQPDVTAGHAVIYFDETLRGLSVGAPVTLLGLSAGEVTGVGLDLDPKTARLRGRVEIAMYPERLIARLDKHEATSTALSHSQEQRRALMKRLIEERGLRAQLRSGNLLTGQLFVAFDYFPDAPKATVDWSQDTPVLPAVTSTVADLQTKLAGILAKIDKIPFEAIGNDAAKALATLDVTLHDANTLLTHVDTDLAPELKTALEDVRKVLARADAVLKSADATLVGRNAPLQQDLREVLQELTTAARSLRVFMDYLDQHPEALLRGKTEASQ